MLNVCVRFLLFIVFGLFYDCVRSCKPQETWWISFRFGRRIYSLYIVYIFIKFIPNWTRTIRLTNAWDRTIMATDELMMETRLKQKQQRHQCTINVLNVKTKSKQESLKPLRAHTKSTRKLSICCVYNCNTNEVNCWFDLITVSVVPLWLICVSVYKCALYVCFACFFPYAFAVCHCFLF